MVGTSILNTIQRFSCFLESTYTGRAWTSRRRKGNAYVSLLSQMVSATRHRQPATPGILPAALIAIAVFSISCGGAGTTNAAAATFDPPATSLSPANLSFGTQLLEESSGAEPVSLTNSGKTALHITSIGVSGTNASNFVQTNNCGTSLAAGAKCTINITFTPSASGSRSATLSVTDSANYHPQTVGLSGTGTSTVAAASLSPTSLTFGSESLRNASPAQTITLANTGGAALSITSLGVAGASASSFVQNNNCGSSVAVGSHCTITVTFKPSAGGAATATLSVADNASGSPQTVSLSGTGAAAVVSLSTTSLAFGSLPTGTASPAQAITLSNSGTAALTITGVAVSGANAGSFIQSNNCGSSVGAGAQCAISVTFKPSASGIEAATLSISDNGSGSPQAVSLTGTGTTTASGQTITVEPTDDLQTLVTEYPASTTFSLAPGTYRLQSVVPQGGDSFVGQTGAIISGAALLTNFAQDGSYWTAEVSVTEQASYPGSCLSTSPVCMYPEDLFFNNVLKTRVASLSDVGPGTWYLDYSNQTAYIGDNPAGQTVEISELPSAFSGGALNVTLGNLIIEKYAAVAQSGAIQPVGTGWTVENCEIRYNHGRGITTSSSMNITNNNVHNNGDLGIGGGGTTVTLSGNQISYNNASGYDWGWEAGGAKFAGITNLIVENNNSYDNNGPGFWNDINSQTVTYTGNQTSGNVVAGILIEISNGITITNNTIVNDGFVPGETTIWYGAGILISTASNVTISGNTVTNCMNGIGGVYSNRGDNPSGVPYALQNVVASKNTITQGTGMAMGVVTEGTEDGTTAVYTSMGNNFSGNTFVLTSPSTGLYFYWMGESMTLATWNSDVN
jgi:hypothetical protein